MKHFVLLEHCQISSITPMIGTICNITDNELGRQKFKDLFVKAVESHFDISDFNHDELPDLFDGSYSYEIMIEVDGMNYEVAIVETWFIS